MHAKRLKKADLVALCKVHHIETKRKTKAELVRAIQNFEKAEIEQSVANGTDLYLLKSKIRTLADKYAIDLSEKIRLRQEEMQADDHSHYLIYRVLGISDEKGMLIDEYQNVGRFLYRYAGAFLEETASLCLLFSNRAGRKTVVKNNQGSRPKTFEIDFLNGNDAVELKWRDATTDGDHITKEHTRVRAIESYGYKPVRIMFYYPQREQAKRIQATLKTIYDGVGGEYYAGDDAWNYLAKISGYDLKAILVEIADSRTF